jgi:hypothetical protein
MPGGIVVLGGQVVDFEVYGPQSSSRVLGSKSEKSQLPAAEKTGALASSM